MSASLRQQFALTQQQLADWMGLNRSTLAQFETGRRARPVHWGTQESRLALAGHGLVFDGTAVPVPAPPAPPLPDVLRKPLDWRLKLCRHYANRTRAKLEALRRAATAYEARYAALPALRASPLPHPDPEADANWITLFELEAKQALRTTCGAGPQLLLAARLAGLEREAEVLAAGLAALPPPADAPAP